MLDKKNQDGPQEDLDDILKDFDEQDELHQRIQEFKKKKEASSAQQEELKERGQIQEEPEEAKMAIEQLKAMQEEKKETEELEQTKVSVIPRQEKAPEEEPAEDEANATVIISEDEMKRLVEDMLTLSRADDGRLKAAMVPVDLSDAVVDTALRFEPVAFEAGRQLSYDIDEGITVTGSRDQLQQVAGVLLDNAIKYASQGAGVYMTLTQAERKAVLTVENGGPPIPPGVLPHLFDRFYRADGSRTQGGFGLGLSIAQAIVREHKGTIRCESDRRSTRFIVTLPAGGKK